MREQPGTTRRAPQSTASVERPRQQPSVLFVDRDQDHLASVQVLLSEQAPHWRVDYASNADDAIALAQRRPLDVVVTGMALAGTDGVALLERVRTLQPHTVRIVLSGDGDEATLQRAIPLAHQWLPRPIEPAQLYAAVDNAITSGALVHRDDLRAILGNARALPSLPAVFAEVAQLIADPEVDIARVTAVVERDPAMAARVLQLANCAFYRSERPMASVREAIVRIGLRTLANCVLAAELFHAVPCGDRQTAFLLEAIEQRARRQAMLLTKWCELQPDADRDARELLPTAGLLHEVGALVLLRFDPLNHRTALRLAQRSRVPLESLERRLIGTDHARVAGSILGTWGLPWPLVDLIANHHDADRCYAHTDHCAMLAAAEAFVATPWLLPEFEDKANRHGWGERFALWSAVAEQVLGTA